MFEIFSSKTLEEEEPPFKITRGVHSVGKVDRLGLDASVSILTTLLSTCKYRQRDQSMV